MPLGRLHSSGPVGSPQLLHWRPGSALLLLRLLHWRLLLGTEPHSCWTHRRDDLRRQAARPVVQTPPDPRWFEPAAAPAASSATLATGALAGGGDVGLAAAGALARVGHALDASIGLASAGALASVGQALDSSGVGLAPEDALAHGVGLASAGAL